MTFALNLTGDKDVIEVDNHENIKDSYKNIFYVILENNCKTVINLDNN